MKKIIVCFVIFVFCGCADKYSYVEYYDDGKLKQSDDGKVLKNYDSNGYLINAIDYANDKEFEYYDNGDLRREKDYRNGVTREYIKHIKVLSKEIGDGYIKEYNANGNLMWYGDCVNDVIKYYYTNGDLMLEIGKDAEKAYGKGGALLSEKDYKTKMERLYYSNGQVMRERDGDKMIEREYYKDGSIMRETDDDKMFKKEYYKGGALMREVDFIRGTVKNYKSDGVLLREIGSDFIKQYDSKGNLFYETDDMENISRYFSDEGFLIYETDHAKGLDREYYKNGTLKHEWNYKTGGEKEYYENGQLHRVISHKNNRTVVEEYNEDGTSRKK